MRVITNKDFILELIYKMSNHHTELMQQESVAKYISLHWSQFLPQSEKLKSCGTAAAKLVENFLFNSHIENSISYSQEPHRIDYR